MARHETHTDLESKRFVGDFLFNDKHYFYPFVSVSITSVYGFQCVYDRLGPPVSSCRTGPRTMAWWCDVR